MVKRGLVVTLDGPAGSGKSTAAKLLAKRLGFLYLDTGAMYRAVALKALREGLPPTDHKALSTLATRSRVTFRVDPGHRVRVLLDGSDVTDQIRQPKVAEAASIVATIPGVRRALVRQQRAIGARGRVVAEGRDTGTVVFPKAELKVFLTAEVTERAKRRFKDLRAGGHSVTFEEVLKDLKRRDKRDRQRKASPLRRAERAVRIDNTGLKSTQVIDKLLDYVRKLHNH